MISAAEFLKVGSQQSGSTPSKPPVAPIKPVIKSSKFISAADFAKQNPAPQSTTLGQKILNAGSAVSDFFGGKALTDAIGGTIAMNTVPENQRQYIDLPTNKQVLASIGELGLNILTLPIGGAEIKAALAVPKAIKYGKLALEGAGLVGGSSGLRSVQEGNNVFSKETAKRTLIGAGIGAIAGPALSILGEGASNLLSKKISAADYLAAAEKKANFGPIPEAATPKYLLPPPRTPGQIPIELPGRGILKSAEDLRKPPEIIPPRTPLTPEVNRATAFHSKQDYIDNEIAFYKRTKQKVPKNIEKTASKAWDEAHKTIPDAVPQPLQPVSNIISKTEPKLQPITKPIKENIPTEQTKTQVPTETINRVEETIRTQEPEVFNSAGGKQKQWIEEAYQNPSQTERIALGKELPPDGKPATLYHSVMSNIAEDTNNLPLIDELSKSPVLNTKVSKAAQELQARQITPKDNIVTVKNKIETQRYDQLSQTMKARLKQEGDDLLKNLQKEVEAFKPTRDIIDKIAKLLLC